MASFDQKESKLAVWIRTFFCQAQDIHRIEYLTIQSAETCTKINTSQNIGCSLHALRQAEELRLHLNTDLTFNGLSPTVVTMSLMWNKPKPYVSHLSTLVIKKRSNSLSMDHITLGKEEKTISIRFPNCLISPGTHGTQKAADFSSSGLLQALIVCVYHFLLIIMGCRNGALNHSKLSVSFKKALPFRN